MVALISILLFFEASTGEATNDVVVYEFENSENELVFDLDSDEYFDGDLGYDIQFCDNKDYICLLGDTIVLSYPQDENLKIGFKWQLAEVKYVISSVQSFAKYKDVFFIDVIYNQYPCNQYPITQIYYAEGIGLVGFKIESNSNTDIALVKNGTPLNQRFNNKN